MRLNTNRLLSLTYQLTAVTKSGSFDYNTARQRCNCSDAIDIAEHDPTAPQTPEILVTTETCCLG